MSRSSEGHNTLYIQKILIFMEMIYRFMYVNEGYEPCKYGFIYKNILYVKELTKPMPDFIFACRCYITGSSYYEGM